MKCKLIGTLDLGNIRGEVSALFLRIYRRVQCIDLSPSGSSPWTVPRDWWRDVTENGVYGGGGSPVREVEGRDSTVEASRVLVVGDGGFHEGERPPQALDLDESPNLLTRLGDLVRS